MREALDKVCVFMAIQSCIFLRVIQCGCTRRVGSGCVRVSKSDEVIGVGRTVRCGGRGRGMYLSTASQRPSNFFFSLIGYASQSVDERMQVLDPMSIEDLRPIESLGRSCVVPRPSGPLDRLLANL